MKAKTIFVAFGLFCLLAGCQQVPDEVRERMKNYGEGGQIGKTEVSYCTIEELRNASIEELDHVSHNLKLPKKVDFSGIESIGTLVLKRPEDYDENKERIAKLFEVKKPEWNLIEAGYSNWYEYRGEDAYLAVDEDGEISYINEEEYDDEHWPRTVKRIHLNREECPQMICSLKSEQMPLSEILNKTQEWVNGCEILQDEFDYELRTVYVKKKPNHDHRVAMLFQRMYKGVGLNYLASGDGGLDTVSLPYEGSQIKLELDEIDTVSYFYDKTKVYIDEESSVDEVIDFQSAVHLVEEELSGFSKLKVCEIRIEYMIYAENGENLDKNGLDNTYRQGAVLHTKPVYSFLIEFGGAGTDIYDTYGFIESNRYVYVNVDMLDGTIITNFKERNFHD